MFWIEIIESVLWLRYTIFSCSLQETFIVDRNTKMSFIPFESSWKKAAERENIREARGVVLAEAEAKAQKFAK